MDASKLDSKAKNSEEVHFEVRLPGDPPNMGQNMKLTHTNPKAHEPTNPRTNPRTPPTNPRTLLTNPRTHEPAFLRDSIGSRVPDVAADVDRRGAQLGPGGCSN